MQYSKGFHVALKSTNLYIHTFTTSSFRVWTHLDLSDVTIPEIENLKKLAPAPNIPNDQLRVQIANFRHTNLTQTDLGLTLLEEVQDLV